MAITRIDNKTVLGELPARAAELVSDDHPAVDAMVGELSDKVKRGDGVALEILGNLALHKDEYAATRADRELEDLFAKTMEPAVMEVINKVREMRAGGWRDGSYGRRTAQPAPPESGAAALPSSDRETPLPGRRAFRDSESDAASGRRDGSHGSRTAHRFTTEDDSAFTLPSDRFSHRDTPPSGRRAFRDSEPDAASGRRDGSHDSRTAHRFTTEDDSASTLPSGRFADRETSPSGHRAFRDSESDAASGRRDGSHDSQDADRFTTEDDSTFTLTSDRFSNWDTFPSDYHAFRDYEPDTSSSATQTEPTPQKQDSGVQTGVATRAVSTQSELSGVKSASLTSATQTEPAPQKQDSVAQTGVATRAVSTQSELSGVKTASRTFETQTEPTPQKQDSGVQTGVATRAVSTQSELSGVKTASLTSATQTEPAPQKQDSVAQTGVATRAVSTQSDLPEVKTASLTSATQTEPAPQKQDSGVQTDVATRAVSTQSELSGVKTASRTSETQTDIPSSMETRPIKVAAKKRKNPSKVVANPSESKRPSAERGQVSLSVRSLNSSSARFRSRTPISRLEKANKSPALDWDYQAMRYQRKPGEKFSSDKSDAAVLDAFRNIEKILATPTKIPLGLSDKARSPDEPQSPDELQRKYRSSYRSSPLYDSVMSGNDATKNPKRLSSAESSTTRSLEGPEEKRDFAKILKDNYFFPSREASERVQYVMWALLQVYLSEQSRPLLKKLFRFRNKTLVLLTRDGRQIDLTKKAPRRAITELIEQSPVDNKGKEDDHTASFELLKQIFRLGGYWQYNVTDKGGFSQELKETLQRDNLIFFDYVHGPKGEQMKHSPARLLRIKKENGKSMIDFVTPEGSFSKEEGELAETIVRRTSQDPSGVSNPAFFVLMNMGGAHGDNPSPQQKV